MTARATNLVLSAIAGILFAASIYCALWVWSSFDLAFSACGNFSLFAETFRCRQPYVALILTVVFLISAAAILAVARRRANRKNVA